jgi:hypothetical protein
VLLWVSIIAVRRLVAAFGSFYALVARPCWRCRPGRQRVLSVYLITSNPFLRIANPPIEGPTSIRCCGLGRRCIRRCSISAMSVLDFVFVHVAALIEGRIDAA